MLKGIDLSYWQRNNYKTLIDNFAKDFVIARAAFSKTVDGYCDPIIQYAKSKGKKTGYYFFPLTSDGTPESSAEWCYNQVTGYLGEAIPLLDWEATSGTNVADVDWAYRWLKKFEELSGVKPMIYMNSSVEATYDWSKVVANDNALWLANYGNNDGSERPVPATKHWKSVAMFQYTSLLDGRGLDGDLFYGDTAAWDAYCGKKVEGGVKPVVPTVPAPTKKNNEEIAQEVIDGKWGNGDDRINRLAQAGYDYNAVQAIVNDRLLPKYETYTVKAGDTLSSIAAKYNTTWQQLAQNNKIQNANLIYPGMQLRVSGETVKYTGQMHTVKSGETLSGIAAQYNTTWQKIASDNGIANANLIYPGQVLRIR